MTQYIIVHGNITEGFTFHGPFGNRDEAAKYDSEHLGGSGRITPLEPVFPFNLEPGDEVTWADPAGIYGRTDKIAQIEFYGFDSDSIVSITWIDGSGLECCANELR